MSSETRRKCWERREKNNLCIYCGKCPPEEDKKGCKSCLNNKVKSTVAQNRRRPEKQIRYRFLTRQEAINKYGGKCICCGEMETLFLTIDHINNDGHIDRKEHTSSTAFYLKLIREELRTDLQVLCFNCNLGRSANSGLCPHHGYGAKFEILKNNTDLRTVRRLDNNCKIIWPNDEELINMVNLFGYNGTAKKLGVSRATPRARLACRGLLNRIKKN